MQIDCDRSARIVLVILFGLMATGAAWAKGPATQPATAGTPALKHEVITLDDQEPVATIDLIYRPGSVDRHPAILMIGGLNLERVPSWSKGLVQEGYMLAAFRVAHPPDPDPARHPQWLYFDQRFAHGYVLGGKRAPKDTGRIIDYLTQRKDVHPDKIGWMGSSSSGIPGLAVATRDPRLAAIVAFVSTGAYRQWLETWHTNGLWQGTTNELWPETEALLNEHDPILHVDTMYPTAVLMVSGGEDHVVDPKTARAFVEAARPYYANDPHRLRLVVYEGFGHNLPLDVVRMYTEHWFHLYMHPTREPPTPPEPVRSLDESVDKTQINATRHKDLIQAK